MATPDDSLFTSLLQDHVNEGAVNYKALAKDDRLNRYLAQIAATDPSQLSDRDSQLAFWINAYNAYTLRLVASVPTAETIREIDGVGIRQDASQAKPWDHPFATVGGVDYTLNHIENDIIRPQFKDPRIHFALVCAAYSCPRLREEAYTADRLDQQLDEQGTWFMSQRNEIDPRTRTAKLSQIFNWFSEDYGSDQNETLRFIADFVPIRAANSLRNEARRWTITYLEYDWSLNDHK